MPQGQDYYTIFRKDENRRTGKVWQLARPQSYRKLGVYREKSLEKTGLLFKNEADSPRHT